MRVRSCWWVLPNLTVRTYVHYHINRHPKLSRQDDQSYPVNLHPLLFYTHQGICICMHMLSCVPAFVLCNMMPSGGQRRVDEVIRFEDISILWCFSKKPCICVYAIMIMMLIFYIMFIPQSMFLYIMKWRYYTHRRKILWFFFVVNFIL